MKAQIKPVVRENLEIIANKTGKYGFPRGRQWIERLLFDPTVRMDHDTMERGAYVEDSAGACVGMYCWFPKVVYHKQTRLIAFSGALLGVDRKFSTYIFDLVDRATSEFEGRLSYGNDCATVAASKFWSGYCHPTWGPEEGTVTDVRERKLVWAFWILTRLLRLEKGWILSMGYCLLYPALFIGNMARKIFRRSDKDIRIVREKGFSDDRFMPFWQKFLASNKGLISSREPAALRWKFDEVIKRGIDVLFSAEKDGSVIGYVLLRRIPIKGSLVAEYSICDICAVDNDVHCLHVLLRAAVNYFQNRNGMRIKYVGAPKNKYAWMDGLMTRRMPLVCNPFSYSGGGAELEAAIKENEGWFFGPYDGERCMGYGAYLEF